MLLAGLSVCVAGAQTSYEPAPENLKARQEFQDAKFGMFIHWGVYSVLGDGEWIFHNRKFTLQQYERLPKFFDPEKFEAPRDAAQKAVAAGIDRVAFDRSGFRYHGRVKALADAAREAGLKI